MSHPRTGGTAAGRDQAVPGLLLIVARHKPQVYRAFRIALAGWPAVRLLRDRRRRDRRLANRPVPVDRRRLERRSRLDPADDPRRRQYVLVRPYARRPHIPPLTQS